MDTKDSVTGNEHHTPVIAPIHDKKNAIGIITINPRKIEIICAGNGYST